MDEDAKPPPENAPKPQERNPPQETTLGCLLELFLYLVCQFSPSVFFAVGPGWCLLAVIASEILFVRLGPPAFPGFLPGLLQMGVLLNNLAWGIAAIVVLTKHFLSVGM